MKLIERLFFLTLLLPSGLWAAADGNHTSREIADVVFRDLDKTLGVISLDLHGGIYVGNTCKTCGDPALSYYHQVIEMTGMLSNATNWRGIIQEGKVKGIGFVNLGAFEHRNVYHGAFMHPDNPDVETRRDILKKAQDLRTRKSGAIDYIVQPGQSAYNLQTKYFTYGDDNTGPVTDENIKRMRSDAFVEYCYASAYVPIMPYDLTTEGGAASLMYLAARGMLPSSQQFNMRSSQTDGPTLTINGAPVGDIETGPKYDFNIQDQKSGAGILKISNEDGAVVYSSSVVLMKNGLIQTSNINAAHEFSLTTADGMEPGYFHAAAYDHAGNSSQF